MLSDKNIIEVEVVSVVPRTTMGGFLESKGLRLADALEHLGPGKYKLTRTWQPPGEEPFSEDLYQTGEL